MRQAVLDIGTNTVKILVADLSGQPSADGSQPTVTPVHENALSTRIGQGVHKTRQLDPVAMKRTLDAVVQFTHLARSLGAEKILCFATSAVRDASNGQQFLEAVKERAGVTVKILSGDEEARYCFAGVASDPMFTGKTIRTMDIGGGSTEICLGDASGLKAHKSLNLGAVRLTEIFCQSDPISECEFAEMSEYIEGELRKLPRDVAAAVPAASLIATGGTATTLAAIDLKRKNHPRSSAFIGGSKSASGESKSYIGVDHYELTNLSELVEWLRKLPLAERKKVAGLPPARADIIVAGATILLEAMRFFGARSITVSVRGARYGALVLNQ